MQSTIKLYDYQESATKKTINFWRKGQKRGILVSPTSSGKTVMAAELINKFVNSGSKVLFLVHLENLIESTFNALKGLNVNSLGKITSKTKSIKPYMCYVGMVQTFKSRLKNENKKLIYENLLKDVSLIVYDEIHLNFFNEFLLRSDLSDKFMLGMSATPKRSGKNTPQLANLFQFKVNTITEIELIKRGFTVPPKVITSALEVDLKHVKKSKISGEEDYNISEVFQQMDKRQVYNDAIDLHGKHAKGLQTIVFTSNIEHAIKTCIEFNNSGIKAKFITSKPPQPKAISKDYIVKQKRLQFFNDNFLLYSGEKSKILEQWNNKDFDVLVNAGIFTTGYDNNKIRCVLLLRPTLSENLYLQMCGRGKRKDEENGKTYYVLIDCASNIEAFGLPTQPRSYDLTHKIKKGKGNAPTKICPVCKNKIPASSRVCGQFDPNKMKICSHVFESVRSTISGEFQEIDLTELIKKDSFSLFQSFKNLDVLDIEKVVEMKDYNSKFTLYKIFENFGKDGLLEFAAKKGIEQDVFIQDVRENTTIEI